MCLELVVQLIEVWRLLYLWVECVVLRQERHVFLLGIIVLASDHVMVHLPDTCHAMRTTLNRCTAQHMLTHNAATTTNARDQLPSPKRQRGVYACMRGGSDASWSLARARALM